MDQNRIANFTERMIAAFESHLATYRVILGELTDAEYAAVVVSALRTTAAKFESNMKAARSEMIAETLERR